MGKPILLKGNHTQLAAVAWANIDSTCELNYQVSH